MINKALISRLLSILMISLSFIAIFYEVAIEKKRKKFRKELEESVNDNPYEIMSDEERAIMESKITDLYIKPGKTVVILAITTAIIGIINILLRD